MLLGQLALALRGGCWGGHIGVAVLADPPCVQSAAIVVLRWVQAESKSQFVFCDSMQLTEGHAPSKLGVMVAMHP